MSNTNDNDGTNTIGKNDDDVDNTDGIHGDDGNSIDGCIGDKDERMSLVMIMIKIMS